MDGPDATDTAQTRRLKGVAVVAGIALVVVIGIYVGAVVILYSVMG